MKLNDGNGLFDKYGMIAEMVRKLNVLADSRGIIRSGIIWDLSLMFNSLKDGLKKEDEAKTKQIDFLETQIENLTKEK